MFSQKLKKKKEEEKKTERLHFIIAKPEGTKLVQCSSRKSCCDLAV